MKSNLLATCIVCICAVAIVGCGKTETAPPTGPEPIGETTGEPATKTAGETAAKPAATPAAPKAKPAPVAATTATAAFAPAAHPEGKLVDLVATGDLDFAALVTAPGIEIYNYMVKDDTGITVKGSREKGTTGFSCVDAISGGITASVSAGYSDRYSEIGGDTIEFGLPLSKESKVIRLYGYSRKVGAKAELFDAAGKSIATTALALDPGAEQTWVLTLNVDATTASTAKLVVSFNDEEDASTICALAVGAVTVGSSDKVVYADIP